MSGPPELAFSKLAPGLLLGPGVELGDGVRLPSRAEVVGPEHGVHCWIPVGERVAIRAGLPHFKEPAV